MKHLILNDLGHVVNLGDRYVHHWLLAGLGQHLKEPWRVTRVSSVPDEKDELLGFTCEVGPDAVGPLAWELLANEWPRERVLATVQEFADDARRRMIENGV